MPKIQRTPAPAVVATIAACRTSFTTSSACYSAVARSLSPMRDGPRRFDAIGLRLLTFRPARRHRLRWHHAFRAERPKVNEFGMREALAPNLFNAAKGGSVALHRQVYDPTVLALDLRYHFGDTAPVNGNARVVDERWQRLL